MAPDWVLAGCNNRPRECRVPATEWWRAGWCGVDRWPVSWLRPLSAMVVVAIVVVLRSACDAEAADPIATVDFNRDIRPILAEHCFACHGPDDKQRGGDLRLDRQSDAHASAIRIDQPLESELLRRIESSNDDERMPPPGANKPITDVQRQTLRRWVLAGAPYQGHWSFQPIRAPQPPLPERSEVDPIDRFLLDKLAVHGLHYAPPVSRAQLIRRASFDLVGLPPTWEEVIAFENDPSPDAYRRLIDRLLESPRYGERWGRHWLDLARYADTHGGAAIGFRSYPFSYTYRDYVIRAFNNDTPYDQFVLEQIAADQLDLPVDSPKLAALGFLTVGMQFRNRHDKIDDQIDVVTRGLMGLTVSCARCHDHKFDPIPTADYYALYAVLAPSTEPQELPAIDRVADVQAKQQYDQRLRDLQIQHEDFLRDQTEVMRSRLRMQVGLYLREIAKGATEQDVSTAFLSYRTDDLRPIILNRWLEYLTTIGPEDPVFGMWVKLQPLAKVNAEQFKTRAAELLDECSRQLQESGWTAEKQHELKGIPPRWNPLILEALRTKAPSSLVEVADLYGAVLADEHQRWLTGAQKASLEAVSEQTVVADESAEHEIINSPVHRQLRRHLYGANTPTAVSDDVAGSLTNRTIEDTLGAKREAIHQLHLTAPGSPPRAMTLSEPLQPLDYHVLERGNPLSRGVAVKPAFLTTLPVTMPPPLPGKRRLELARAIVSRDNPLTPRVIVNWVWQHHFGQGLVTTPDDFGSRGVPPMHPELLDYLANRLMQDGWSIKNLHRAIMLSQAYQQGSIENDAARAVDADNHLFWRMPRRRLDFEAMRDAMLFTSGELDITTGGRPIDLTAQPAIPRRSIYGFVNRDVVSPLMSTFDAANPNACTAKRVETTVPQQTLFALNSEFIQDRAVKLQQWVMSQPVGEATERIASLYQQTLSRRPTPAEVTRVLSYLGIGSSEENRAGSPDGQVDAASNAARWQELAHALLASNEFLFLD